MGPNKVTLAEAIHELRKQILTAVSEGADQPIRFMPETVEIELGISFDVEAEAGGGFKLFSLVDLSGKTKVADQSTHKVKMVLKPVGRDGKPTLIGSSVLEK
jgi:hypothetical protein